MRCFFLVSAVRITNYTLHMNQVLRKRDLARLTLLTNASTLADAQMVMNASIQYAVSATFHCLSEYIVIHLA